MKFAGYLVTETIKVTLKIGVMVYKIGKDCLKTNCETMLFLNVILHLASHMNSGSITIL